MKTIYKLSFLLMIVAILTNCTGEDGEDGNVYLSINEYTNSTITKYWDDNDDIPYGLDYGTYYSVNEGIFNYSYTVRAEENGYTSEKLFEGTYTITREKGEDGGFMSDGDDALDSYYDFYCGFYQGMALDRTIKSLQQSIPDQIIITNGFKLIITTKEIENTSNSEHPSKL